MKIEVPIIKDKELQKRLEEGLIKRGFEIAIPRSLHAEFFIVVVRDAQDAFWIGCNYVALVNKLYDGPLTKTFG